jgi:tRNA dimethylallyltransferase
MTSSPLPSIPILVGPTASGKTPVGLALARILHGEIISADSRQVYRFLDIGTAKPPASELRAIPHHFVDELHPDEKFNAGLFGTEGRERIDAIIARRRLPIVVGGSGLYVRSLIDGFFEGPGADKEFRASLESMVEQGRVEELIVRLRRVDPVSALSADPTKPRRIIRALEVYHQTGRSLSELHKEHPVDIRFTPRMFGLSWDRRALYERINGRCDEMIRAGLLEEVERLEQRGYTDTLNALNTVGYAEAFAYRRGETSHDEFVRLFKQNSRRYAKRQLTWFRRDGRIRWIEMSSDRGPEEIAGEIAAEFSK